MEGNEGGRRKGKMEGRVRMRDGDLDMMERGREFLEEVWRGS